MDKEVRIAELLTEKGLTITTAESCTGGLIAGRLIAAPGISAVYREGFVTYSNEAKEKRLGVSHETLERFGAVSAQTAEEMARGVRLTAEADVSVVSTGIAGPGGGTPEKPVGLVYLAASFGEQLIVRECHFDGDRAQVRAAAVECAMDMLLTLLEE